MCVLAWECVERHCLALLAAAAVLGGGVWGGGRGSGLGSGIHLSFLTPDVRSGGSGLLVLGRLTSGGYIPVQGLGGN